MGAGWLPLWTGARADAARELAREWAAAIDVAPGTLGDPSLFGGTAGRALLHAYLGRAFPKEREHDEKGIAFLERTLELTGSGPVGPGLLSGLAGVGWVLEHLKGWLVENDENDDPAEVIDDLLLDALAGWDGPCELVSGLAGIGVYALARRHTPSGHRLLAQTVQRLASAAQSDETGTRWFTRPEWLSGPMEEEFPKGHFNLGLAHGMPAVLPVLAGAAAVRVEPQSATALLEGARRWLWSQRTGLDGAQFGAAAVANGPQRPTRSAWCYGDPGIALALAEAGQRAGRPKWQEEGDGLLRAVVARPEEGVHAVDASLCHGWGGLGHIFHRRYQATGAALFRDAADRWLGRMLSEAAARPGIEGLRALFPVWDEPAKLSDGLGDGVAGGILALVAAVSPQAPDWDQCLLMSALP